MFRVLLLLACWGALEAGAAARLFGGCPAVLKVPRPERTAAPDRAAFARIADPFLRRLAENVTHIPQADLEASLRKVWKQLLEKVPKASPIVVWSRSDRSNGWVALLLYEWLVGAPPPQEVTFFDNDYSRELFEFLTASPNAHVVVVDDGAYSAAQVTNTIRGFRRVLSADRLHVGVGYATSHGERTFRAEHPGVDFQFGGRMQTVGELFAGKPDLLAAAALALAAGWETKVVTYFDHTIADEKSTVSLRDGRLFLPLVVPPPDRPY